MCLLSGDTGLNNIISVVSGMSLKSRWTHFIINPKVLKWKKYEKISLIESVSTDKKMLIISEN